MTESELEKYERELRELLVRPRYRGQQYTVAPAILNKRTGKPVPKAGKRYHISDLGEAVRQADSAAQAGLHYSTFWGVWIGGTHECVYNICVTNEGY